MSSASTATTQSEVHALRRLLLGVTCSYLRTLRDVTWHPGHENTREYGNKCGRAGLGESLEVKMFIYPK